MRVVIAEDLALLRDGLIRLLRDTGFEVAAAVDHPDAFLEAVPGCAEALQGYSQDGNRLMLEALDEQIRRATAPSRSG